MTLQRYYYLFCFLISSLSWAQSDTIIVLDSCYIPIKNLYDLDKINPQTALTNVYHVEKHKINQQNGTQISDILIQLPSVQLKDYGGIGGLKTISVRSLGASHTKVLLDGIPMMNTETGQIDLGKFPTENISSFSLIHQQWNAPLQTAQAYAGGSILAITSTADSPIFTQKNHFSIGLQEGSFGFWKMALDWKHQLDSSSFLTVYSHIRKANGKYIFNFSNGKETEKMIRQNGDITEYQEIISYGKTWKKRNLELRSKVFFHYSERGLPGAVVLYNPTTGERLWDSNFFIQHKLSKNYARFRIKWINKYNHSWKKYLDPNFQNEKQQIEDSYWQQNFYNSLAFSYPLHKKWDIFYSTDHEFSSLKSSVLEHPTPQRHQFLNVLGSNYQFKKWRLEGNLLSTAIIENTKIGESSTQKQKITPSISAGYKPFWSQDFRIRFSYKQTYRYPSFNDLYYVRVGNIHLKPELATQWNGGINYIFKAKPLFFLQQWHLKMDAFWYEIENKIVAIPTRNLFVWSMQNYGHVQTKGLEFSTELYFLTYKNFSINGQFGYSFQQALDKTNRESLNYGQQIPYIPFQTSNTQWTIDYKKWSFLWNYNYSGHRFFLPENVYENMLPSWHLHDIGIHYQQKKPNYQWRIKASINNLLNIDYQVIINYPMPKTNYQLSFFIEL